MTNSFVTLEDVNGALFNNQECYWHTIDTSVINTDKDFSSVHIDFCTISRTKIDNNTYDFDVHINTSNWTLLWHKSTDSINMVYQDENRLHFTISHQNCKLLFCLGNIKLSSPKYIVHNYLLTNFLQLSLKELQSPQILYYKTNFDRIEQIALSLNEGYNVIEDPDFSSVTMGFCLVKLLRSDFQFQCTQSLTLGKGNTVKLGALDDYKPNGAMIGSNVPNITVKYGDIYIPVRFDTSLNDYVFDIDLTNKQTEGKVRFNVIVDTNDVLNNTETEVTLNSSFETINNESKLQTLFRNGGIGKLGANITLTTDLTLDKDVLIIGNGKTINMQSHKIIVPTERTFKSENTIYTNGYNTIQQYPMSTVELTDCTFNNCTGLGSVIDCQLDMESLEIENDFITNITGCTFTNNDLCILHGGELNIENCTVTGKIGNPNYPYFLYQTDRNATILQSNFNLSSNTQISTDIEFNSCIFICGETATVNGYDHTQLQNNNITSFTTTQRNSSTINVTYYYPTIEDYITLESSKGYCHSVSDVDYVFKANVTVRRNS